MLRFTFAGEVVSIGSSGRQIGLVLFASGSNFLIARSASASNNSANEGLRFRWDKRPFTFSCLAMSSQLALKRISTSFTETGRIFSWRANSGESPASSTSQSRRDRLVTPAASVAFSAWE